MDKATFTRRLREALTRFYDPAVLQTSPLAELVPHSAPQELPTALREVLRTAIESLRPPASVPYGQPEWIGYRLLWALYIQRQPRHLICDELGLSRTSFYRHQQQALEAISALLWAHQGVSANAPDAPPRSESAALDERATMEAVRLAEASPRVAVSPAALARDAFGVLAPLAEQRGVALCLDLPPDLPAILGDPGVLHQILIGVAMAALERLSHATLRLEATALPAALRLRLSGWGSNTNSCELNQRLTSSQRLLAVYGGRVWLDAGARSPAIVVELPTPQRAAILVADDDPQAIALYQRYLQAEGYAVGVARNGAEISQSVAERRPDLILLDVLMPQEDGWVALQRLKTLPETAGIPVIVYSVLGQPSLALALGALRVLRKPIQEAELLRAVREALAPGTPG